MATNTPYSKMTLLERARRTDPKGNLAKIAEVLVEDNPILWDAPWMEANGDTYHKSVRRTYEPSGTVRKINQGVATSASRTIDVFDSIMTIADYSEADTMLVDNAPDPMLFRTNEARAHISGIAKGFVSYLLYGSVADAPEEINGFATRMGSLATTTNVRDAGGSGSDVTSIFIVQWGLDKVFMVYPRGRPWEGGVKHKDLGEVTVSTATTAVASSAQYQAYRDYFEVSGGLVVRDDRCTARLANIESTGTSNIFDEDDLITLLNRMPGSGAGATIYVNDTIATQMEIALKDKNNVNYAPGGGEGLAGDPVVKFRGHPVKKVDQILITETAIT